MVLGAVGGGLIASCCPSLHLTIAFVFGYACHAQGVGRSLGFFLTLGLGGRTFAFKPQPQVHLQPEQVEKEEVNLGTSLALAGPSLLRSR